MNKSDDNERLEEEEELSSVGQEETNNQTVQQSNDDESKLQHDLANELKHTLKIPITDELPNIGPTPYKVAIVGMNELGSATAFLLICRQVVTDIIIIDKNSKRLAAEYADLSTCTTFVSGVNIQASNQLASCEGARVVILCDVSDDDDDHDHEKQQKSTTVPSSNPHEKLLFNFKITSRAISHYASDCVMIIAVQPFEVMTQLCAANSMIPSYRIIAPGTMIDSAHFRLLISEKLDISPASITGIMIGGHGHNNLPLWNSITVGGIHLLSENTSIGTSHDKENWHQLHRNVNQRQEDVIKIKGTEVWSISMASSELVECILRNKREIHTVTVNIKDHYGVKTDLFLSIPAIISQNGVSHLITMNLANHQNENEFASIIQNIETTIKEKLKNI
ncbi:unnamed protein product [Rotaria magnacalcarata]|uniref:L-lactate dehydrogenase n=1 Tax=Rotaria magnacalcarata TaxID=392030 RepID=A0A819DFM5_9BILA|nr:unnamed protein product [Rotaria magnacalcarata]CAF2191454.1 unnamed protein product [Rotaria magnacalcarata]CAF3732813.1 unnamed protein product [Rotaria magnacalcarata]CAF3828388.1 unnamed protein product [Rotaria magnacalcarata]